MTGNQGGQFPAAPAPSSKRRNTRRGLFFQPWELLPICRTPLPECRWELVAGTLEQIFQSVREFGLRLLYTGAAQQIELVEIPRPLLDHACTVVCVVCTMDRQPVRIRGGVAAEDLKPPALSYRFKRLNPFSPA